MHFVSIVLQHLRNLNKKMYKINIFEFLLQSPNKLVKDKYLRQ